MWTSSASLPYLLKLSSQASANVLSKKQNNKQCLGLKNVVKFATKKTRNCYLVIKSQLQSLVSLVNSHGARASPRLCFWVTMSRRGGRLTNFNPHWHPGPIWDLPIVPSPHPTSSCLMHFSFWMELPFPLSSFPRNAFTIPSLVHFTFFSPSLHDRTRSQKCHDTKFQTYQTGM